MTNPSNAAASAPLPHPGGVEISALLDSILAEYNWPSNPKNAARAGWTAAMRYLATPHQAAEPAPTGYPFEPGMNYFNNSPAAVRAREQRAEPAPTDIQAQLTAALAERDLFHARWKAAERRYTVLKHGEFRDAEAQGVSPAPRAVAEPGDFVMVPRELLSDVWHGLAVADAMVDAVPTRDPGHLGKLVNDEDSEGKTGYRRVSDSFKALSDWLSAAPAPTPSEDARMLDWLETQKEAYGFADVHEGNNWLVEGPFRTVREAIRAAMSADSNGEAR